MLRIIIKRYHKASGFTLGKLFIQEEGKEPVFFCTTLEPEVRKEKVWGKTAIPEGTYTIRMRYSYKFSKRMPFLQNVPNFTGVMIHTGNNNKHTQGCVLVGELLSEEKGIIWHSQDTFKRLLSVIEQQLNKKKRVTITITSD